MTITPREVLNQTLPALGADVDSLAVRLGALNQPDLIQFLINYVVGGGGGAFEAQIQVAGDDPPTVWHSVPAFDDTTPAPAPPNIDIDFGEGNWVQVGGNTTVRLVAEIAGALQARIRMREVGDTANPGDVVVTALGK